ncbi:MAG: hypothetical protein MAG458_00054 [Nitrosopumilus sp.]|nr:hypothetical protein [Nitrosopumilus sp.]
MEKKFVKKILQSGHRLKSFILFSVLFFTAFFVFDSVHDNAYGHGVGSEIFPPVELNGKQVALEVSSSQNDPETSDDQQISISLIDFDSKITLRDVTFLITSHRGDTFLFEKEFKADNGFVVFNFISKDTDSVIIEEQNDSNLFGSLLGLDSRLVNVSGPKLSEGGLYKLDISIITAEGYSKKFDDPLIFNAGISIAQTTRHNIVDPNFGEQYIDVVTFYDEISDFQYDSSTKETSFFMPFEWTQTNIDQTSVVHEELIIPESFGDMLVSGFTIYVNDLQLSDDIVTIDDFFSEQRTVHFIIYQKELQRIFDTNSNQNGMNFVITPDRDYTHLSSVTENGQFRILVSWDPENLKSNDKAKIIFDVTDIFLKNRPIATPYEFSITQNEQVIFEQNGISSDSKENPNVAEFFVPKDISGVINLNFNNLDNNNLAKTAIPIVIDRVVPQNDISIPSWIKNNAGWWSSDDIDDETFVRGIEYLVKNQIISTSSTAQGSGSGSDEIPAWIKNNAGWWADGSIDDETFVNGIEYLVEYGIIRIN